jgi:hypothetical protein
LDFFSFSIWTFISLFYILVLVFHSISSFSLVFSKKIKKNSTLFQFFFNSFNYFFILSRSHFGYLPKKNYFDFSFVKNSLNFLISFLTF